MMFMKGQNGETQTYKDRMINDLDMFPNTVTNFDIECSDFHAMDQAFLEAKGALNDIPDQENALLHVYFDG